MPRQPGVTGPDTGPRFPKVVAYCIDEHRTIVRVDILNTERGILNFQESSYEFLWWILFWFWVVFACLFWWGIFLFACLSFLFGLGLVWFVFFDLFFFLK